MNSKKIKEGNTLTELVEKYNSTNNEIYFNQLWEQVKAFSFMITNRYNDVEYDEKISISQEVLWKCCKKLKKGKNLLTLYGTALKNRFYDEWAKRRQTQKYRINSTAMSLDQLYEEVKFEPAEHMDIFNIEMFIDESKLTGMETDLCILLYEGFKRSEIMNKLNMTNNGQYNRLIKIVRNKVKINYLAENLNF